MLDARIDAPSFAIDALQPFDLLVIRQRADRIERSIKIVTVLPSQHRLTHFAAGCRDRPRGTRRFFERSRQDFI